MFSRLSPILAALLLASPGLVQANTQFDGLYLELATGNQQQTLKTKSVSWVNLSAPSNVGTISYGDQSVDSAPLILGLGYDFPLSGNYVLGLGLDYSALASKAKTFSGRSVNNTAGVSWTSYNASFKVKNSYDLYVSPGYRLTQSSLLFAKLGYFGASVENGHGPDLSSSSQVASGYSKTNDLSGYIIGVGYKIGIAPHLYAFAEGDYTATGKKTFSAVLTTTIGQKVSVSDTVELHGYNALIGMGYQF